MATYTSPSFSADKPFYFPKAGERAVVQSLVECSVALILADTLNMIKVPAGVSIIGGRILGDATLETGAGSSTLRLDVGTPASTALFLDGCIVSGAELKDVKGPGILVPLSGVLVDGPYAITTDTDIIITVAAAPNATGTGTLTLQLDYTLTASYGQSV